MSVTTEAIEKVKEMILSGELQPGAKLPRENELAERLGVSRSSLREAVRALAALNVIETRQGDGTYVTSLTPEVLPEVIGFGIDLVTDPSLLEVFEVRRFLETAATTAAATTITEDELASLRECMDRMARAESVEELVRMDEEFREKVVDPFVADYLAGRPPSPCVRCNTWVKFDLLLESGAQIRDLPDGMIAAGQYLNRFEFEQRGLFGTAAAILGSEA